MPRLSVTIVTRNEAAHVEAALASVAWADERVVVDAESTDDTARRAERAGARVVVRPWQGFADQKNHAASIASNDWILSLDADERISDRLRDEIRELLASEPARTGYRMPRVTRYLGRWVRSTDWFPDYQLRLYDRRAAHWSDRSVHESVSLDQGTPGQLGGEILHYAYRDLAHHLDTINRYTTLAAEDLQRQGRRVGIAALAVHPPAAFLRNYLLRGGIRDGSVGMIVSAMNAYYVFLKLAKLWERGRQGGPGASGPGS